MRGGSEAGGFGASFQPAPAPVAAQSVRVYVELHSPLLLKSRSLGNIQLYAGDTIIVDSARRENFPDGWHVKAYKDYYGSGINGWVNEGELAISRKPAAGGFGASFQPAPAPAPVSGFGAPSYQPAVAAPAPVSGYGAPSYTPAAAAGGFGAQSAMCDHCKSNLKHPGYSYCSHSCGIAAKSAGGFGAAAATNMCIQCGVKAKQPGHNYCGITCAGAAKATATAPSSETFTIPNGQKVTIREYNGDFIRDINGPKQITIYRGPGSSHGPNEIIIPRINTKSNTFVDVPHFRVKVDQNTFKWVSLRDLIATGYRGAPFNESLASSSARTTTATTGGIAAVKIITFYEKSDKNTYIYTNYFSRDHLFIGDQTGPHGAHLTWKSTEHYFQVYKFLHSNANVSALYGQASTLNTGRGHGDMGPQWATAIVSAGDGYIDKTYWHESRRGCEPGKLRAMYNAVKMKFTQNPDLRQKLINTGNAILVENAGGNDIYWGDGSFKISGGGTNWDLSKIGDSRGENRLGLLLMQIRDELTRQNTCPASARINTTIDPSTKDPSYNSSTGYFNLNHWPC